MTLFPQNGEMTYEHNPYYEKNTFLNSQYEPARIPSYDEIKDRLPRPIFDRHDDYIECYNTAWRIAFGNLQAPSAESGFVADFIDTAFNGHLFMWDSSFIMMFTKYAERVFPFQKTLDNFYALQHKDGFICREIDEKTGKDCFTRFDPSATGPNILLLAEWCYFEATNDLQRLKRVYYPLRAFHRWLQRNYTWRDGSYFSSGWGCGMDNLPRLADGYSVCFSNGKMVWVDTCMQQLMNTDILMRMNTVLGGTDDTSDLAAERDRLSRLINEALWDEKTQFYYDLWENGQLNMVKHIGAYWALLAKIVPDKRLKGFVSHLKNEKEFNRPNAVPTLSADHPQYAAEGGYWRGGVWAPTNYMVLRGLTAVNETALADVIAEKYLKNVVEVWKKTGTLFENYSPEYVAAGNPSKPDFVGWTGLAPISVFFEYVLGIMPYPEKNKIVWHVNQTERHGICNYPFGASATLDLICEARGSKTEEPQISVVGNTDIELLIIWDGGEKIIPAI